MRSERCSGKDILKITDNSGHYDEGRWGDNHCILWGSGEKVL